MKINGISNIKFGMLDPDLHRKLKRAADSIDGGNNPYINRLYQYVQNHSAGSFLIEQRRGNRGIIFDTLDRMGTLDVSDAYKEDNENNCYLKMLKIMADYMKLGQY